MKSVLTAVASIFIAYQAQAGGWVSAGGGELFRDAHNPWFLKNVDRVTYCVSLLSPATVSASKDTVRTLIAESFAFWKAEFARQSTGQFQLGTQSFEEVPCSSNEPDIRFLIGYDSLSAKEIEFLNEPTKFIGVSIRTSYGDGAQPLAQQMRGKGFVFIASDIGPKSYHEGKDPNLIARAWEKPQLLKLALLHEIGHLFGFPHTGAGLMSETFLEQILGKLLADTFVRVPIPSFLSPDDRFDLCSQEVTTAGRVALAMPADHSCLRLARNSQMQWEITSRKDKDASESKILGKLIAVAPELLDYQPRPAVTLQLLEDQKIFSYKDTKFRNFMFGPMFVDSGMKGNLVLTGAQVKPVYVRITPDSLRVEGVANNKVELFFAYTSPLGLLLMQEPRP